MWYESVFVERGRGVMVELGNCRDSFEKKIWSEVSYRFWVFICVFWMNECFFYGVDRW